MKIDEIHKEIKSHLSNSPGTSVFFLAINGDKTFCEIKGSSARLGSQIAHEMLYTPEIENILIKAIRSSKGLE